MTDKHIAVEDLRSIIDGDTSSSAGGEYEDELLRGCETAAVTIRDLQQAVLYLYVRLPFGHSRLNAPAVHPIIKEVLSP